MKNLPEAHLNKMKEMLSQEDYQIYLHGINDNYYRGIRINTLKCTAEKAKTLLPFELKETPFCENGFYIPFETQGLGNLPLHRAGGFYSQEPSAMSAVKVLDVQKGDRVLDLCAAPGGKSTQIAAALGGTGLLWSNEIVKSRANILLSNIERMGIPNAVVSSCRPDRLCEALAGCFDKVLVDAPCSGEGMFRRDDTAVSEWSAEHSLSCAERQLAILGSAADALREGGELVYSTCTFSREENEGVVEKFLETHHDFELVDCGVSFGRRALQKAVRILPADGGEGHFAAKLRKRGELEFNNYGQAYAGETPQLKAAFRMYDELFKDRPFGSALEITGDKILILPEIQPVPIFVNGSSKKGAERQLNGALRGTGILRAGLLFGEIKKNRIEPCHALFMAAKKEQLRSYVELSDGDERLERFFRGEEIEVDDSLRGFTAVLYEGITVGFGKAVGGVLKNRYPKGLRAV